MKFGKEFASQMVPEWQEAYMDYNYLKAVLKDVLNTRKRMQTTPRQASTPRGSALKRRVSLYRAFSGLTGRNRRNPNSPLARGDDEEVILVNSVTENGSSDARYQTMFLMSTEEGGEYELVFFRRLDEEFNKVVRFYRKKVQEVEEEADRLTRQMNALIALRVKVDKPDVRSQGSHADVSELPQDRSGAGLPGSRKQGRATMDVIQEVEMRGEEQVEGESRGSRKDAVNSGGFRPAPLEILDHVKINVAADTPVSTLKGILMISDSDLSFSKAELRKAEERMTRAFIEFYQKLRLLKSYCFLNQLAFSKIMKKYDKITLRSASKSYLKMVDDSYLGSSDEVNRLVERVENTFIKHFANGNRRKGMKILRPTAKREKHRITFLLGSFFGCSLALTVAIAVVIHARDVFDSPGRFRYMDNIFPLYSLFGFIVLHMIMYAGNIYFWRRYRINYSFIFGFKQGTELGYREVLLLSFGLAVLTLAAAISNLDMEMDPKTEKYQALTEMLPLALLLVVIIIAFLPFNIIFRSSRFFLIWCAFHCICAPLYKVTLPEFFLADQLTSQVQSFRNISFYVCYYGWGDFRKRLNKCAESKLYEYFFFIVAIIPYWFRFLQCIRRLIEERDPKQGYNSLKYLSTIVALIMKTIYDLKRGVHWKIWAAATSGVATIINTYWDLVVDWGLLRRNSKNPWLRDKLAIPSRGVYFVAMVLNVILRLGWMQTVMGFREAPFLHRTAVIAIFASLEIIRRGIWNFFRLENEHLNNVGKYRAFKSVPLPFQHDDDKRI
ncbi:phosphate transporter PHO1 homolog 9-like [Punica granatum]|uniref:Phosphate transporter PHO1 homolog 9-like n=3 Tax=Punica granatum TaxID=22663 RepID=A0A6P8DPL1_PUNGR|nr:phosphate transporter PHO1 homolog 9-like [Punica granatum]